MKRRKRPKNFRDLPLRSERARRAQDHELHHRLAEANTAERIAKGLPLESTKLSDAHLAIQRLCDRAGWLAIPLFTLCRMTRAEAFQALNTIKACYMTDDANRYRRERDAWMKKFGIVR